MKIQYGNLTIMIEEGLRLRRFDGNYDFAFEWYQDPETVLLVDGKTEPYSYETLTNMYHYLNDKGELYFIEVNEDGKWKPIGDVAFWQKDMPIVIGEREYRGKGIGKKLYLPLLRMAEQRDMTSCMLARSTISTLAHKSALKV